MGIVVRGIWMEAEISEAEWRVRYGESGWKLRYQKQSGEYGTGNLDRG